MRGKIEQNAEKTAAASEELLRGLAQCQASLFTHCLFLAGRDEELAWEILQETNLHLCSRAASYDRSRSSVFTCACAAAKMQALKLRKQRSRQNARFAATEEELERLAELAAPFLEEPASRVAALRACMEKLPQDDRALLWRHYEQRKKLQQLADERHCKLSALKMKFLRLRERLARCILEEECALEPETAATGSEDSPRQIFTQGLLLWEGAQRRRAAAKRIAARNRLLRLAALLAILLSGAVFAATSFFKTENPQEENSNMNATKTLAAATVVAVPLAFASQTPQQVAPLATVTVAHSFAPDASETSQAKTLDSKVCSSATKAPIAIDSVILSHDVSSAKPLDSRLPKGTIVMLLGN